MPTSGDHKSGGIFLDQHPDPPDRICRCNSLPENFFFDLDPLPTSPHPTERSVSEFNWFYTHPTNSCLNRNNKETTLFFLFTTTCITQENEARNHYTSIRSQMILEFWNIWSLNLSFLWATDQNFLLSRSFGHPHRRAGDWLCIRETSG